MFALVDDVGRYPEFLPWCTGSRIEILSATERLASVDVARGILRSQFTTRNLVKPGEQISMRLVQGPFQNLTGEWHFDPITAPSAAARGPAEQGSRVHFRMEFEFKNRLTALAFNPVFESVCATIVDAFAMRAQKIYG